jgi:hypothetical protein
MLAIVVGTLLISSLLWILKDEFVRKPAPEGYEPVWTWKTRRWPTILTIEGFIFFGLICWIPIIGQILALMTLFSTVEKETRVLEWKKTEDPVFTFPAEWAQKDH